MSQYHCPYCREDLDYQPDLSDTNDKPLEDRIYTYLCQGKSKLKPHSPALIIIEVLSVYVDRATGEQSLKDVNIFIFQIKPRYDFQTDLRKFHNERGKNAIAAMAAQAKQEGPEEQKKREKKKKWNDPNKAPFKCLVCRIKTGPPNYKLSKMSKFSGLKRTYAMECTQDVEHKYPITFHVKRMVIDATARSYDVPAGINVDLMLSVLFEADGSWIRWMTEKRYDPRVVIAEE